MYNNYTFLFRCHYLNGGGRVNSWGRIWGAATEFAFTHATFREATFTHTHSYHDMSVRTTLWLYIQGIVDYLPLPLPLPLGNWGLASGRAETAAMAIKSRKRTFMTNLMLLFKTENERGDRVNFEMSD
jgi:hypothetical protein